MDNQIIQELKEKQNSVDLGNEKEVTQFLREIKNIKEPIEDKVHDAELDNMYLIDDEKTNLSNDYRLLNEIERIEISFNKEITKQWLINEIQKPVEEKINIDFNLDYINYVLDLIEEFKENNENYLNPVEADFFDEEEAVKSSTELENLDIILEKLATHENTYIRNEVAKRGYDFFNQNKEKDIYQIEDNINKKETLLESTARISLNVLGNIKPLENFVNKQIIPNTKQYKDLVGELKTKPSEQFYMDGERRFSDTEKRMLKVFEESIPKAKGESLKLEKGDTFKFIGNKDELFFINEMKNKTVYYENSLGEKNEIPFKDFLKNIYDYKTLKEQNNSLSSDKGMKDNNVYQNNEMAKQIKMDERDITAKKIDVLFTDAGGKIVASNRSVIDPEVRDYETIAHIDRNNGNIKWFKDYNDVEQVIEFANKYNKNQKKEESTQKRSFEIDSQFKTKIENMEQKEQEKYLQDKIKYLGFGESEDINNQLKKGMESNDKEFTISLTSDKGMKGNEVNFSLNFNKSDKGGVFLNSYDTLLKKKNGEELSHNFRTNITAKESINLLEGRAVKTTFNNKEGQAEDVFIKLKLKDEKNEYGNYQMEYYNKNYGIDVDDIMKKSNLVFENDLQKERTKKHLEKGNLTSVVFQKPNEEAQKGFAYLNPQYKMLNMYDSNMKRVNTNKEAQKLSLNDNQKNNVKEYSSKRTP